MSETRKLAAILVADVVGYSRLAGADEERMLARLRGLRSDLIGLAISPSRARRNLNPSIKPPTSGPAVVFRAALPSFEVARCSPAPYVSLNQIGSERTHMTAAFTLRLDDDTLKALDRLAQRTDRSRSWLAARAIEEFIALNAWQIEKIEAGINAADRGDFADDREVARVLGKYSAED